MNRSVTLSPDRLLEQLNRLPAARRYRIAFSGGLDSSVLLHLFASLRDRLDVPVDAIHVDHGLHPDSPQWAERCRERCRQMAIACETVHLHLKVAPGQSPEAAARDARYGAFIERLRPGEQLVTAHHADDQAETLLLQLLRGAGPHGLAGMPDHRPLGPGLLVRPLLAWGRQALLDYAGNHELAWIDDPSNFDTGFDRNFLRHEILPPLRRWRPGVASVLARSAGHFAEAAELLDVLAARDLAEAAGGRPGTLSVPSLVELGDARARNAIRRWLSGRGLTPPASCHLERIVGDVLRAPADAEPVVDWPGGEVRRYRGDLFAMAPVRMPADNWSAPWDGREPLVLPGGFGVLELVRGRGGLNPRLFEEGAVTVRFRAGGERCRPAGRGDSHPVKKLFQEAGVPPWERRFTPLLFAGGEVAAVAGLAYCSRFAVEKEEEGLSLAWHRREEAPDRGAGGVSP